MTAEQSEPTRKYNPRQKSNTLPNCWHFEQKNTFYGLLLCYIKYNFEISLIYDHLVSAVQKQQSDMSQRK